MVNFRVEIAGVEYPFTNVEYERDYSFEAQPFTVDLPTRENVSGGGTVDIYRDGDLVYRGKIYDVHKATNGGGPHTQITGFDLKRKSGYLLAVNRTENDYPGTQIINNLPDTELTQGTISDYGGSLNMEYGSKDESKFGRKSVFEELAFVTGWEINVSPSGILNFKSQCGTNRSGSISFNYGELLHRWIEPYKIQQAFKIKKVTVIGSKAGPYMNFGTAVVGGYVAGDLEKVFNRKNLVDNDTCGTAATSLLADFQNDAKMAKIEVIDTYEGCAYDVFDTVKLKDDILEIDENLRVYHVTKRFGLGVEQTELSLCNIQHLNTNAQYLLRSGEAYITESARGSDNFARTNQMSDSIYTVNDADQCDDTKPLYIRFYVPTETELIRKCKLSFQREDFRAYSKSAASENLGTKTSQASGDTKAVVSSHASYQCPDGHDDCMVGLPVTTSVNTPTHTHNVVLGSHTHGLTFGIYEEASPYGTIALNVNGTDVDTYNSDQDDLNILTYVDTGWNYIKLTPNARARISVAVYIQLWIRSLT